MNRFSKICYIPINVIKIKADILFFILYACASGSSEFHTWRHLRRLLLWVLYAESFCLRSLHSAGSLRSLRCSHGSHPSDRIILLLVRTVLRSSRCSDSPVHSVISASGVGKPSVTAQAPHPHSSFQSLRT